MWWDAGGMAARADPRTSWCTAQPEESTLLRLCQPQILALPVHLSVRKHRSGWFARHVRHTSVLDHFVLRVAPGVIGHDVVCWRWLSSSWFRNRFSAGLFRVCRGVLGSTNTLQVSYLMAKSTLGVAESTFLWRMLSPAAITGRCFRLSTRRQPCFRGAVNLVNTWTSSGRTRSGWVCRYFDRVPGG